MKASGLFRRRQRMMTLKMMKMRCSSNNSGGDDCEDDWAVGEQQGNEHDGHDVHLSLSMKVLRKRLKPLRRKMNEPSTKRLRTVLSSRASNRGRRSQGYRFW